MLFFLRWGAVFSLLRIICKIVKKSVKKLRTCTCIYINWSGHDVSDPLKEPDLQYLVIASLFLQMTTRRRWFPRRRLRRVVRWRRRFWSARGWGRISSGAKIHKSLSQSSPLNIQGPVYTWEILYFFAFLHVCWIQYPFSRKTVAGRYKVQKS